jgi:hypothetical protein
VLLLLHPPCLLLPAALALLLVVPGAAFALLLLPALRDEEQLPAGSPGPPCFVSIRCDPVSALVFPVYAFCPIFNPSPFGSEISFEYTLSGTAGRKNSIKRKSGLDQMSLFAGGRRRSRPPGQPAERVRGGRPAAGSAASAGLFPAIWGRLRLPFGLPSFLAPRGYSASSSPSCCMFYYWRGYLLRAPFTLGCIRVSNRKSAHIYLRCAKNSPQNNINRYGI